MVHKTNRNGNGYGFGKGKGIERRMVLEREGMVLSGMKRVIRSGGEGPIKGECESPIIKRPGSLRRGSGGEDM